MHFILIGETFVKLETITSFRWYAGSLLVTFYGRENPITWDDPTKSAYYRLKNCLERLGSMLS